MPLTSAFTPTGLFELSGETSDGENIYNALASQLGEAFDLSPGTYAQAKLYACAMQMAWARAIIKRVPRELHPLSCYDLLTTLEKDWACVPNAKDTLFARQMRIAARKLLMRGSREEAIVTDLTAAIGTDFIKLNKCPTGSEANYPTMPSTVGTFPNPSLAPNFYKLQSSVSQVGVPWTVLVSAINASSRPLVGQILTFEPEIAGISEAVTLAGVTDTVPGGESPWYVTGTFTNAHSVGAWVVSAAPLWLSNRYQLQVVISDAASKNQEQRRQANAVMQRHAKSCERWKLVAASSSTQVGPFVFGVGHNVIGATALGATPTNF